MNELEFKRHLKELAHGHHHPEEHDWNAPPDALKKTPAAKRTRKRRPPAAKSPGKK